MIVYYPTELAQSHYPSFYGLFILLVLICRSFLYHLPLNTSSSPTPQLPEPPQDRAVEGGTGPPGNLGFLRNVLMRRQAASPRFLLWAFWGHSPVQLPHQEGSYFREPRKNKRYGGDFADLEIVFKVARRQYKICSRSQTLETPPKPSRTPAGGQPCAQAES